MFRNILLYSLERNSDHQSRYYLSQSEVLARSGLKVCVDYYTYIAFWHSAPPPLSLSISLALVVPSYFLIVLQHVPLLCPFSFRRMHILPYHIARWVTSILFRLLFSATLCTTYVDTRRDTFWFSLIYFCASCICTFISRMRLSLFIEPLIWWEMMYFLSEPSFPQLRPAVSSLLRYLTKFCIRLAARKVIIPSLEQIIICIIYCCATLCVLSRSISLF